jgi:hypothetical protein
MAGDRMATMTAAIALRSDFTGPDLRRLARRTEDGETLGRATMPRPRGDRTF